MAESDGGDEDTSHESCGTRRRHEYLEHFQDLVLKLAAGLMEAPTLVRLRHLREGGRCAAPTTALGCPNSEEIEERAKIERAACT